MNPGSCAASFPWKPVKFADICGVHEKIPFCIADGTAGIAAIIYPAGLCQYCTAIGWAKGFFAADTRICYPRRFQPQCKEHEGDPEL